MVKKSDSGLKDYINKMGDTSTYDIHFGGPDLPSGRLRDLLAERVTAVPAGGKINWVTYYFRDRRLAAELLQAHRRGVKVTVTLDAHPRSSSANEAVMNMLAGPDGLGTGFRVVAMPVVLTPSGRTRTHLHEKLYYFSHPRPVAYIGSFNPSGDDPEESPDIIREIGDQDCGHNLLVGLYDPDLVSGLLNHANWLHRSQCTRGHRFSLLTNRMIKGADTEIHFWPRVKRHPVMQFLKQTANGARIRIAASHLKGKGIVKAIIGLAENGAAIEVLAEHTLRRVPHKTEQMLTDSGILFRRVCQSADLPMHNKFVLVEKNGHRRAIFGSFNWTTRSYWLNHEIGAISASPKIFDAFEDRWEVMKNQAEKNIVSKTDKDRHHI